MNEKVLNRGNDIESQIREASNGTYILIYQPNDEDLCIAQGGTIGKQAFMLANWIDHSKKNRKVVEYAINILMYGEEEEQ